MTEEMKSADDTNYIQFDADDILNASGKGHISTLREDREIVVEPFVSENEDAPTHKVYGFSPRRFKVPAGEIWRRKNKEGNIYFTIHIPDMDYRANLGQMAGQDDPTLQKLIQWSPKPQMRQ